MTPEFPPGCQEPGVPGALGLGGTGHWGDPIVFPGRGVQVWSEPPSVLGGQEAGLPWRPGRGLAGPERTRDWPGSRTELLGLSTLLASPCFRVTTWAGRQGAQRWGGSVPEAGASRPAHFLCQNPGEHEGSGHTGGNPGHRPVSPQENKPRVWPGPPTGETWKQSIFCRELSRTWGEGGAETYRCPVPPAAAWRGPSGWGSLRPPRVSCIPPTQ